MSARSRVFFLVALAAVVASGAVVIGVLATRSDVPSVKPRKGSPPLALDLGLRSDPEARALRRAQALYKGGKAKDAAAIFGRYRSLEAQVGSALASWPAGTVARLETLAGAHARSSLVALELGLALYWSRKDSEAVASWRAAKRLQPDTPYAIRAGDLLHPQFPVPGLPRFVPSFPLPRRLLNLSFPQQFSALRAAAAAKGDVRAKILYGLALQQLGHPVSAEREFAAAARLAPDDPDARVAAAVGRFDKSNPSAAFSRLGPLVRVFPHAQTVRFHLGVLLLWSAQVRQARIELRQARTEAPNTPLGHEAAAYLAALRSVGTR